LRKRRIGISGTNYRPLDNEFQISEALKSSTVDSIDYKKAMLLFYEQNNISRFKEIFINQFEFAVNTYF